MFRILGAVPPWISTFCSRVSDQSASDCFVSNVRYWPTYAWGEADTFLGAYNVR
jgi:hypothetical protein